MDPIYGFQAVNVEAQTRDRSSLLNWMKRMLQVRKSSQAFGRGALRIIRPGNRKVLAYVREYGDDTILCVINLARSAQPVELDLAEFKARVPIEMMGRTPFPPIGDLPYLLTLPGYAFYWFHLSREAQAPAWHEERLLREDAPVLVLIDRWHSFFPEHVALWRGGLAARLRAQLEERALPQYIATQRWYGDKGARISRARMSDQAIWSAPGGEWLVALFDVEGAGESSRYFIPLTLAFQDHDEHRWARLQAAAVARARQQARTGVLADAFADEDFCRALVEQIGRAGEQPLAQGRLRFTPTKAYPELRGDAGAELSAGLPLAQSSNTALRVGERLFLKAFRRIEPGVSPELEMGRFLTEVAHFPNVVPLAGAVEYVAGDGTLATLVLLQAFVQNQGDGWDYTVNYLVRFLEDRRTAAPVAPDVHGAYLALMHTLGQRAGELHLALATPTQDPAFAAEPITPQDIELWRNRVREEALATLELLARAGELPEQVRADGAGLVSRRDLLLARLDAVSPASGQGLKIRHHGDFHLGQVLLQRNDFVIADFEGEPGRPLVARRDKSSPLRDVAGMLRSFLYARSVALRRCMLESHEDCRRWEALLDAWEHEARGQFLGAYAAAVRGSALYSSFDAARPLLELFELEKALYELRYELRNRPDWVSIPLSSLLGLAGD
jgi:maltose alpha-D-glucosyltransferase / alpha-amylase